MKKYFQHYHGISMSTTIHILPKFALHCSNIFFAWLAWTPQNPPSAGERNAFTSKPETSEYLPNFTSWFTPSFNVSSLDL